MSLFDSLYSIGIVREMLWRMRYPFLTKQLRGDDVLFLNYALEPEPPIGFALEPQDASHPTCVLLYHHVAP